jgi:hypothetical protein
VWPVELGTSLHGPIASPVELHLTRAPQHALVCCRPLEALLGGQTQDLVRDTSLAGPESARLAAENFLMESDRSTELLAGILRVLKVAARQTDSRVRFHRDVSVAKQGKDGMVERRG